MLSKDQIRSIFMQHGFTIKEGQTDLKPYVYEAAEALINAALSAPAQDAQAEPVVTEEMIAAYLEANDRYWKETDDLDRPISKWRNGTPSEATRVSLQAALRAARTQPATSAEPGGTLVLCDQSTGKERVLLEGPRAALETHRARMAAEGRDVRIEPATPAQDAAATVPEELEAVCKAADAGAGGWVSTARIREALAATAPQAVAHAGRMLVPVEPTPEMLAASWANPLDSRFIFTDHEVHIAAAWGAMLDAAPTAPQASGIAAAAQWVRERRDKYIELYAIKDPDTGELEFGRGPGAEVKREYVCELEEIIEGIEALEEPQASIKEEPLRKLLEYAESYDEDLSADFVIKLVKEALGET